MRKLNLLKMYSLDHLCTLLKCRKEELYHFCENPRPYYYEEDRNIKGKIRHTATPIGRFGKIVVNLKDLLNRLSLPDYLFGGIRGKSAISNAAQHIHQSTVLGFDISDFFPSIKPWMVYNLFRYRLQCGEDIAKILTQLTTFKDCVPQGSPTSTVIANLIIAPCARRLKKLAEHHRATYTQFVDDGVVSGPAYLGRLRPLIEKILSQEHFIASPKPHKRKTCLWNEEQVVTGVKVNRGIDVPEEKLINLRKDIQDLKIRLHQGQKTTNKEIRSLQGRARFIRQLNPRKGSNLLNQISQIVTPQHHPTKVTA